jgi:RNA polymerase sigma-70 factor, ECF subfamily
VAQSPNPTVLSDDDLMSRARADDADAFAVLFDRHSPRALRVARSICPDGGEAEDVVREGFLAVWRMRASFREGGAGVQAWLMAVIQDRAIDASRGASGDHLTAPQDRNGDPLLLASLGRLPSEQASAIVLAFFGDLTHTQIAAQLDLPPGMVERRMRLGLEMLRGQMAAPIATEE